MDLVELRPQLLHLPRQIGRRSARTFPARFFRHGLAVGVERRQHARRCALQDRQVLAHQVLELHIWEEWEGFLYIASHLVLMPGETLHRQLEIVGQEHAQAVVIKADELTQETDREQIAPLAVLLEYNLGED